MAVGATAELAYRNSHMEASLKDLPTRLQALKHPVSFYLFGLRELKMCSQNCIINASYEASEVRRANLASSKKANSGELESVIAWGVSTLISE